MDRIARIEAQIHRGLVNPNNINNCFGFVIKCKRISHGLSKTSREAAAQDCVKSVEEEVTATTALTR
jgi:hypothetical protein